MGKPAVLKAGGSCGLAASRPCALRGLIFNQAPAAGRYAHKVSPTANGFAVGSRPATCRRGVLPLDSPQPIINTPGFEIFA